LKGERIIMTMGAIKINSSSKLETIKKFWKRAENKQKIRTK